MKTSLQPLIAEGTAAKNSDRPQVGNLQSIKASLNRALSGRDALRGPEQGSGLNQGKLGKKDDT